ncbi:MAG: hypothetical protein ABIB97_01720 [Patescibacteria group bacterium]
MRIMESHAEKMAHVLAETELIRNEVHQWLTQFADQVMQERVSFLLYQDPEGLADRCHDSHQELARRGAKSRMGLGQGLTLELTAEGQIRTIYAVLAPIFFAMGNKLPQVKGEQLDAILEDLPPADFITWFEQLAQHSNLWYQVVQQHLTFLADRNSKAAIWAICRVFVEALPEGLG